MTTEVKKEIAVFIYFLLVVLFFFLSGCESPTAPKERNQDTQEIRNDNGGRN